MGGSLEVLRRVAEEIRKRNARRVAIDGRCASGKSMFARELAALLNVRTASTDDFHNPPEQRYRLGEYSPEGYYRDAFNIPAIGEFLSGEAAVVFEGMFLFRPELNPHWDFRLLLDIDAATSISRAVARDSGVLGPEEVVRRKYELRYEPAWQLYVSLDRPEQHANIIIGNTDFSRPRIVSD
jgi:uridine kinase